MKIFSSGDWPEVSALLDVALDLPPGQRETWLESLSGEAIRLVPVLRELLARESQLERHWFLERLPHFTPINPESFDDDASLSPGTRIGPYLLNKMLGRGGMSTVFLARRVDGYLKRDVALKLPHGYLLVPQMAERFARERDILAGLTHANIARLYDAGVTAEGQPYLAMEFVDGTPFIEYSNSARLGIEQRLLLFQQVLAAVRHAHSKLVLHRDLKPSNILVTAEGRVLLLDFGIARLIANDASGARDATQFGGRALTPAYASPEQIAGESLATASDVYSLGVILYELLTGARPYRLQRETAAAVEEAILNSDAPHLTEAVLEGQAARLDTTSAKLRKALRGDLDAIVRKALRKNPSLRYATVEALARDLTAYSAGEPVSAHAESRGYLLKKFVKRHMGTLAATTVVFLVVVAGGTASLISAHVAIVQRDRALALASRNEAITVFLNHLITDAAESDKPVTISDMLSRSEALIAAENRGNSEHQAAVLDMLAMEYRTNGEFAKALALSERAFELVRESRDPSLRAQVACDRAGALDNAGRKSEAVLILRAALQSPIDDARVEADCLEELADSEQDTGNYKEALELSVRALVRLRQTRDANPSVEAEYIGSVALLMSYNDQPEEAQRYFKDAIQRLQALGRGNSGTGLVLLNDYGVALDNAGNPKQAIVVFNQVLAGLAKRDPTAVPWVATLVNLGRNEERAGRFMDAKASNQLCVDVAKKVGQLKSEEVCLFNLAIDEIDLEHPSAAEDYVTEALKVSQSTGATKAIMDALMHLASGEIAVLRHQSDRARTEYDAVLRAGAASAPVQRALLGRARVNLEAGNYADAMHDAKDCLAYGLKRQGSLAHSNFTGLAWVMIAKIRDAEGDHAGGRDAARSAVAQLSDTVDSDLPQLLFAVAMAGQ